MSALACHLHRDMPARAFKCRGQHASPKRRRFAAPQSGFTANLNQALQAKGRERVFVIDAKNGRLLLPADWECLQWY